MLYNDKVGYGPTVSDALTELFGPGAGATATNVAPTDAKPPVPGQAPAAPPPAADQANRAPEVSVPIPGQPPVQLSPAKAAALQEIDAAVAAAQEAQRSGDFAKYGQALQGLADAMKKYDATK
jgi:uncharacterized membrane protein (UPF0182 family)